MSLLERTSPSPRRTTVIFFLVDCSESMNGKKINAVNDAMRECSLILEKLDEDNDDSEVRIAVLAFSDECIWLTSEFEAVPLEQWKWTDITPSPHGKTNLGKALIELESKMSKDKFLSSVTGGYAPVIILLSDGLPTDNWPKGISIAYQNVWFRHAMRIAVDIDGNMEGGFLSKFTGDHGAILHVVDQSQLSRVLKRLTVLATKTQCSSKNLDNGIIALSDASGVVQKVCTEINGETQLYSECNEVVKPQERIIGYKDFMIRRASFACMNKNHHIENVNAVVTVMPHNIEHSEVKSVHLLAGYCRECNIYFIMESTYEDLLKHGIPACRVSDEKTYVNGVSKGMVLAQESILHQYGYTVNQQDNLSSIVRQRILAFLVDCKILSINEVISYLEFFINQRKGQTKYREAISRWEADKIFIRNYKLGTYRMAYVQSITL